MIAFHHDATLFDCSIHFISFAITFSRKSIVQALRHLMDHGCGQGIWTKPLYGIMLIGSCTKDHGDMMHMRDMDPISSGHWQINVSGRCVLFDLA
jgi:hypothetical protein